MPTEETHHELLCLTYKLITAITRHRLQGGHANVREANFIRPIDVRSHDKRILWPSYSPLPTTYHLWLMHAFPAAFGQMQSSLICLSHVVYSLARLLYCGGGPSQPRISESAHAAARESSTALLGESAPEVGHTAYKVVVTLQCSLAARCKTCGQRLLDPRQGCLRLGAGPPQSLYFLVGILLDNLQPVFRTGGRR